LKNIAKRIPLLATVMLALALFPAAEANHLAAFSDPARLWGDGVERVIEEAFRAHFRTRIIGGKVMNIRMPFAKTTSGVCFWIPGWTL